MKNWIVLLSLFASVANAQGIDCNEPQTALDSDFCQISYKTLARMQEMQINAEVSADLDILKMQTLLTDKKVQVGEIQPQTWNKLQKIEKANRSLGVMLKKTNQLQFYKAQENLGSDLKQRDHQYDSSTGTRGGCFGNEDYVLPTGFWID